MTDKYELLTNYDIEELCRAFRISLVGCVAKDQLKKLPIKNSSYVINLNNSNQGGSHWVGLYINNNDACYFDSFGIAPPKEVLIYCKNKNFVYNKDQIQNLNQVACGYYVIAFLHHMSRTTKSNLRTNLFMFNKPFNLDKTSDNDDILQNYLRKLK